MDCPKCGADSSGNYCSNCGTNLKESNVATMERSADAAPPMKPPRNKTPLIVGCGCLTAAFVLLLMLGLIGSLIYSNSTKTSSNLSENNNASVSSTVKTVATATTLKTSSNFVTATVTKVIDGDTIDVNVSKKTYRVRLIGVDTPETKDPRKSVQYFGIKAFEYTTESLNKRVVYLEYDTQSKDKYDRTLAYVWLSKPDKTDDVNISSKMFNAGLLLNGYAQVMTVPPNVKYVDYFKDYQKEARTKEAGLWKEPATTTTIRQTTTTTEKPNPTTTTTEKTSITSTTTNSGDVTVYITRTGSKYHSYGCQYLRQSCIPIKLSDAIAQGYTPCSKCGPPTR